MSSLFSVPKPKLSAIPATVKERTGGRVIAEEDQMRKRLAAMMGRQQTILEGPFAAANRKTVLGM